MDNCKNCPWGIKENTYCQDEDGDVLDPHTAVSFLSTFPCLEPISVLPISPIVKKQCGFFLGLISFPGSS